MTIAIGGMKKQEMEAAIKEHAPQIETIVTTDIGAAPMLKSGEADYYFGACESGGGAAISILIGMLGYNKTATVARPGQKPDPETIRKYKEEGKIVFGMSHNAIDETVPMLLDILMEE